MKSGQYTSSSRIGLWIVIGLVGMCSFAGAHHAEQYDHHHFPPLPPGVRPPMMPSGYVIFPNGSSGNVEFVVGTVETSQPELREYTGSLFAFPMPSADYFGFPPPPMRRWFGAGRLPFTRHPYGFPGRLFLKFGRGFQNMAFVPQLPQINHVIHNQIDVATTRLPVPQILARSPHERGIVCSNAAFPLQTPLRV